LHQRKVVQEGAHRKYHLSCGQFHESVYAVIYKRK
jgi:hypothetical protein